MNVTLLGYIAAICTTCSFIPQVIQTVKTKDTSSISLGMYSIFVIGVTLWLIYGLIIFNLPIVIANAITLLLATFILILKIKDTITPK
jgi:MtN3 and saliva related transmembrane protein